MLLDSPSIRPVGIFADDLVAIEGGNLWSVSEDRKKRLLWQSALPIEYILPPFLMTRFREFLPNLPARLLLRTIVPNAPENQASSLHYFDLRVMTDFAMPVFDASSTVVAADTSSRSIAVLTKVREVETLEVAGTQRKVRSVLLNAKLQDIDEGQRISLHYKDEKGDELTSWLLLSSGARVGHPLPTIVDMYPGHVLSDDWDGDIWEPASVVDPRLLVAHGFAVLIPSMPMVTGDDDKYPASAFGPQVLRAIRAAEKSGYIDTERLAVQGESYGGYAVAIVVAQLHIFRAAVAGGGLYDLISAYGAFRIHRTAEAGGDLGFPELAETGQEQMGVPPWGNTAKYIQNSPLFMVEQIDTPIMLVHGDLDQTVPHDQAEEMFIALKRLGKDALFISYGGEGHGVTTPANVRDLLARVLRWYDGHLEPVLSR